MIWVWYENWLFKLIYTDLAKPKSEASAFAYNNKGYLFASELFRSPFPLEKQKRFLVENQGQDRSKISFVAILEYKQILHRRKILDNFLSNILIVDTLKYCALKLSLLSTELDIASLSLLRSFHNIMHREGTNFIYFVGRFFFYIF